TGPGSLSAKKGGDDTATRPGMPSQSQEATPRPSVRHLPGQPDAAAGIVLGRRPLRRGRAIAQAGLQLQVFGEIDVHLHLTGAIRRLCCGHVHPLRDVLAGRDACTARRASTTTGPTAPLRGSAPDRQRVETEPLLEPRERVPLAAPAASPAGSYAAETRKRGAGLRELQRGELGGRLAEEEQSEQVVLRQGRTRGERYLRRIREAGDVQRHGRRTVVHDARLCDEVECRIDLALQPLPIEADLAGGEIEAGPRKREGASNHAESAAHQRTVGSAPDLKPAAELGVEPPPLDENGIGRIQAHAETDDEPLGGRRGWRSLARTNHIQGGDIRRKPVRNADRGTVDVYGPRHVDPLPQRPG